MSRVLLDTSGYSAFLRGDASIKRTLQEADEIVVNPVILGELKAGFLRGTSRRRNEDELARFLGSPRVTIAPMDEGTADRYAAILDGLRRAGTPIPTNDLWVAATAMQHGLRVVTTDAHFLRVPQILVEPSRQAPG
jgi:predicted nucleic acid-binding protein